MRRIDKGPEPSFLQRYRLGGGTPPPSYGDFRDKVRLRDELVERQGRVCCYCQRPIGTDDTTTIEHFRAQSTHPDLALAWGNLWAACDGNRGAPRADQHCDARKADQPCDLDPAAVVDARFRYTANGEVRCDEPALDAQLDDVLNLNARRLTRMRAAAVLAMTREITERNPGQWSAEQLERRLAAMSAKPYEPFVGVLIWWLRKRIARG